VRTGVRRLAEQLGLEKMLFGGMSLRIGFATDAFDVYGMAHADDLIRQMGRWQSDIWQVYARLSAETHMRSAEEIESSAGASLEELAKGWVQPGTRRR